MIVMVMVIVALVDKSGKTCQTKLQKVRILGARIPQFLLVKGQKKFQNSHFLMLSSFAWCQDKVKTIILHFKNSVKILAGRYGHLIEGPIRHDKKKTSN